MNVDMFSPPHFLRVNLYFGNLIHVYKIFWWLSPLPSHTWHPYPLDRSLFHIHDFWFLLWYIDCSQNCSYDHMLGTTYLSLVASSSVGTQQLPLPKNPLVGSSSAWKGRAHEAIPSEWLTFDHPSLLQAQGRWLPMQWDHVCNGCVLPWRQHSTAFVFDSTFQLLRTLFPILCPWALAEVVKRNV